MHTINRQTENAKGTGLPVYRKREYQERFTETYPNGTPYGFWQIPNNKLPTLQFWVDKFALPAINTIELIPTNGTEDGTAILIGTPPTASFCVTDADTLDEFFVTMLTDDDRDFTLECGTYYIRFTMSNADIYYSEVFKVGGVCSLYSLLSFTADQVNMDNSVDTTMTLDFSGTDITSFSVQIGASTYITSPFNHTFAVGDTSILVQIESDFCGTYAQSYNFNNNAGLTFTLTKTY